VSSLSFGGNNPNKSHRLNTFCSVVAAQPWWTLESPCSPSSNLVPSPYLLLLFKALLEIKDTLTMQLLLNCSVIPRDIMMFQEYENPVMKYIFYVTRTYVLKIFVTRR
jgi:hypothetical protein